MSSVLQSGGIRPAASDAGAQGAAADPHHQRVEQARRTFSDAESRAQWQYRADFLRQALARPGLEQWERDGLYAELDLHYAERYSHAPAARTFGHSFPAPTAAEVEAVAAEQQAKREAEAADVERQVAEFARGGTRR